MNVKRVIAQGTMAAERAIRGPMTAMVENLAGAAEFLFLEFDPWLGSAVQVTPVFEALKAALPEARISVACSEIAFEVHRCNPLLDRLVKVPSPYDNFIRSLRAYRAARRREGPASRCVITSWGARRFRTAIFALGIGRAARIGFSLAPELLHRAIAYDPARSIIDNNLRILELLGLSSAHVEPHIFFCPDHLAQAQNLISTHGLGGRPMLAALITQTSGLQRTQWRDERFSAVGDFLAEKYGCGVVFVGTAKEAAAIERIRAGMRHQSVSLAGQTTIPLLAALLSICDVAVSVDTGTMHVARASGLPTIVIATAWQKPTEWLPVNRDPFIVLRGDDMGRPDSAYSIEEIGIDRVNASIDKLLGDHPPPLAGRQARILRNLGRPVPS